MSSALAFVLAQLLIWHLIADLPLQPAALARAKRRPGSAGVAMLLLHGAIHGVGVGLILGSVGFALAETAVHALIDWGKCRNHYGLTPDQCAHVACQFCWLLLASRSV